MKTTLKRLKYNISGTKAMVFNDEQIVNLGAKLLYNILQTATHQTVLDPLTLAFNSQIIFDYVDSTKTVDLVQRNSFTFPTVININGPFNITFPSGSSEFFKIVPLFSVGLVEEGTYHQFDFNSGGEKVSSDTLYSILGLVGDPLNLGNTDVFYKIDSINVNSNTLTFGIYDPLIVNPAAPAINMLTITNSVDSTLVNYNVSSPGFWFPNMVMLSSSPIDFTNGNTKQIIFKVVATPTNPANIPQIMVLNITKV